MASGIPLTPDLVRHMQALFSPADFAEHFLRVELRPYQKHFLKSSARRRLMRWGRRTGKSFCCAVLALWYAFTHTDARVLVCYPVEDQVHGFFRDQLRSLIARNPDLFAAAIEQDTRHPEAVVFANGSSILGFTAGTRAGAQAMSVRGQRADLLILDEAAFMENNDVNALLAIAAERPDIIIVCASTCQHQHGKFYEFWRNSQDPDPSQRIWADFHTPTWEMPGWDGERSEREWKMMLGEDGYLREIAAEFAVATTATVFPAAYVRRACRDYPYLDRTPPYEAVRVMGVDWDKYQASPVICVCEWDPGETNEAGEAGMLKVILREEVGRSEFTLDSAVHRIIDLKHTFAPQAIYVDRGFAEYQVEVLHKLGRGSTSPSDPTFGLDRIVKGISFSSSLEIPDPATGEVHKKPIKPFMINQTQLLFERDRIRLSSRDQVLIRQLLAYEARVGTSGRPIYSDKQEHAIDALALCVLALVQEFPELARTVHATEPATRIARAPGLFSRPPSPEPPPASSRKPALIRTSPPETDLSRPHFIYGSLRRQEAYRPSLWPRGSGRGRLRRRAAF